MASTSSSVPLSIPTTLTEGRFRENFKAGLRLKSEGIMSYKLLCTVCNVNIKHRLVTGRNEHVILGVLLCNCCSHRIRLAVNKHAETNNKNWCRWCANEISNATYNLVTCRTCNRKFCQSCIKQHSPRERIRSDAWTCFACSPNQQWYDLRALCSEAIRYTEDMKKDLDERRKRTLSMITSAARRRASGALYASPRITTNISTRVTSGGQSNMSATLTVSTSPMMRASSSTPDLHNTSHNTLDTASTSTSATTNNYLSLTVPSDNMNLSLTNSKLDDDNTCVICLTKEPQLACVPCGHLCLCETCFLQFDKKFQFHRCPICRQTYFGTLKIFHGRN